MIIEATSDLHGQLPSAKTICGDVLVLAGDICPDSFQREWLVSTFAEWVKRLTVKRVVATWGNHDFIGLDSPPEVEGVTWLCDSGAEIDGIKFWGSPWSPRFFYWAFMKDEPDLAKVWAQIPDDCQVAVLHGPPSGVGDLTMSGERVGSPSLTKRLLEIPALQLAVFGHIHEACGQWKLGNATWANVSLLDDRYRRKNDPFTFVVE